ncbi:TonB-dependent receptor [Sphingobacterium hungaricum]
MKFCFQRLLFICIITAISYSFGYSQSNSNIRGFVLDEEQNPIVGATITLNENQASTSDENGSFSFTNVISGKYELTVRALGYEKAQENISLNSGQRLELTITLLKETSKISEVTVVGKSQVQQAKEQRVRAVVIDTRAVAAQATSLTELMNQSTGIRIRQSGGLGSRPELSMNGFQGRSIKYFRDGIPLDYLGDGFNIGSLPLEILDRVEVYKGVLPVSLGADALGGAVNLVGRPIQQSTLHASYEIASFNTHRLSLNGTYVPKNERWFAGADVFFNHSDNDYKADVSVPNPETRNPEIKNLPLFHNAFTNYYGEFYAGVINRSWADELRLGVALFQLRREQQHPALMTDAYGAIESKQHTIAPTLRYKKSFLDGRLTIDQFASYNVLNTQRIDTLRGRYDWYGNFTPKAEPGESRLASLSDIQEAQTTVRTNLAYRFNENHRLEFNYVLTNANRKGEDPYGAKLAGTDIDVLSLASTYQKQVFGLSLTDYFLDGKLQNELIGKFYVYQAEGIHNTYNSSDVSEADRRKQSGNYWGIADAIKYQLNPSSLVRASVEWAYRLPERDELFGNNVFVVPNFELTPEQSLNVNLGYRYDKPNFSAEANTFYRNTKDMILLVPIQAPNAQYQNLENVKGYGFELDFSYRFWTNYKANANATWQDLRLFGITNAQNTWQNDARLRNTPYFFANAGLQADYSDLISKNDRLLVFLNYNFLREFYLETIPKDLEAGGFLGLSGSANITSDLLIPDQHLLNIGSTYRFPSKKITIGAEVKNLMNKDLFDYYRIQRAGRSFHLKLSYSI